MWCSSLNFLRIAGFTSSKYSRIIEPSIPVLWIFFKKFDLENPRTTRPSSGYFKHLKESTVFTKEPAILWSVFGHFAFLKIIVTMSKLILWIFWKSVGKRVVYNQIDDRWILVHHSKYHSTLVLFLAFFLLLGGGDKCNTLKSISTHTPYLGFYNCLSHNIEN